ncbi:MAG: ComEC/Rec2 family competence protein, partial [Planctomycetota bacterium]
RAVESGLAGRHGLAPALLVGERALLDSGTADLFTRTGTRHLLALSGLHVGLLVAAILFPSTRLAVWAIARATGRPRAARACGLALRLLGVGAFALLAGGAPPVVRAALAVGAGLLATVAPPPRGAVAIVASRRADALSIWAAALCLECLWSPRAVLEVSIGLSYAATLGILVLAPSLASRMRRGTGTERRQRQALRWMRGPVWVGGAILFEHLARIGRLSVACSLAAVVSTLPFVWERFGEVAPVGVPATLVGTPLLALLLVSDWIAVATLQPGVIAVAVWLEALLVALFEQFDRWPGSPCLLPEQPWPRVAALSIGLGWALARGRLRWIALSGAALLAMALGGAPEVGRLRVDLLDVGHGTCAVVRAPGHPVVVFDAGARDRSGIVATGLRPLARREGWRELVVVSSHADFDHRSGLPWLLSRCSVALWLGEPTGPLALGVDPPVQLDVAAGSRQRASADGRQGTGGRSDVVLGTGGDALRLTLLRGTDQPGNEGSRSLILEWRGRRLLLSGDAVGPGLDAVLAAGDLQGPFDLALLPHHGGHGPAVGRLLDRLGVSRVWISCSGAPPLAHELCRRGLDWHATGIEGSLSASW